MRQDYPHLQMKINLMCSADYVVGQNNHDNMRRQILEY